MEIPSEKKCTKCGVVKALEDFGPQKAGKWGRHSRCRPCLNEYQRAYKEANAEKVKETWDAHYAVNRERLLQEGRDRYAANREEVKQKHNEYYAANREKVLAKQRETKATWTEERFAHRAAMRKELYEADKERYLQEGREYYEANKEKVNLKNRTWQKNNLDKNCARVQERRLRKLEMTVEYVDYVKIYERDLSCYLCGGRLCEAVRTNVDHIIPINRTELGPTHSYRNCAGTCQPCNNKKFNRTPEEYWMMYEVSWLLTCRDNWITHETPWYYPQETKPTHPQTPEVLDQEQTEPA